mmetsp:Transcript_146707/g.365835  ORF Transcript_146707/g.365835 Transcript_146707/m.365835 type:complete len:647 (+) Transcript_146707:101-2041(+)
MQLKVVLPSGEVNVPVEPNSTPGHLKENLKYSIRVPPKLIKLTCDGRELDDIKPLVAEPNNLSDGAIVIAEAREGVPEETTPSSESKPTAQPTMIKKEEPPKPKKVKKDVVRPTLAEGDVVKGKVVEPGYQKWEPEYVEGKHSKRHLAFLKIEAVSEKKKYPEQEESSLVFGVGDPQTSPVWTAVVMQMEVGEKAQFKISRKAVDFDLEGLMPSDSCSDWIVELVRIVEVEDVNQDFSQLLHVESKGKKERAAALDTVSVHWRFRRWMAEGMFCIASSRERIAIMPGYGLVPIEDQNAPPVSLSVGEGQQEGVEMIAMKCGPGGVGHLYLKTEAMKGNRPQGCVVMDVEVVSVDQNQGPGSPGWRGWQSLIHERETGDAWLDEADGKRKQLETFGMLKKSTGDSKDAEANAQSQVHKFATNAARRYRRTLKWIEADEQDDRKIKLEKATVQMRLAKASTLSHARFGDAAEAEATEDEKNAIKEALELLKECLAASESLKNENLVVECLKMTLQVHIQGEDVGEARQVLERLLSMRPEDDELKSDSARINRLEGALNLKKGASTIETVQKDLQAAVTAVDKPKVTECVSKLHEMIKGGQVTWDTVRTLKVGKDVGNAMKMGDPDIAAAARKVVQEIQALAQRAGIGL